jgi:hypothetical protein
MGFDLTTFTKVDSDSDFTVTTPKVIFDTMRRDAVSYLYDDFGAGHFGDFDIDFELKIDACDTQGNALVCAVSNTATATFADIQAANDGIVVWAYSSASALRIYLSDYNTDNSDFYTDGGTSSNLLYCSFKRSSTTANLYIYSNAARTSLIDTLAVTCETGTKRYFYAVASRDIGSDPSDTITGYTQNFTEITVSHSESPSESPSTSPSASESPSLSPSISPSESASLSPSASESPSESASLSPSASESPSLSPTAPPGTEYYSNGSFLQEEFTSLTGWTDNDSGGGVSTQETFNGESTFKFDATSAAADLAGREQDFGTITYTRLTVTFRCYIDTVGGRTTGKFRIHIGADPSSIFTLYMELASDGFFIYDGGGWNEAGTNEVTTDTWQTWTIDADITTPASATCNVYKNGILLESGIDCSYTAGVDGRVSISAVNVTNDVLAYIDYLDIGNNLITASASESPSESPSLSPSASESPSESLSESPSESLSESPSLSPSASESPSESPSQSPSASESPSESPSQSPSASESPSLSTSESPSLSPSESPSQSPSASESPSESPSLSPSASESPSESFSMSPSESPSESASESPSESPSVSPSVPPGSGAKSKLCIIIT